MKKHLWNRFSNLLRCYGNYALSLFGLVRSTHMPAFVSVEPAAICQLRCPECPVGRAKTASRCDLRVQTASRCDLGVQTKLPLMSRAVWERVLEQAAPYAHTIQFYFQGEPLLNADLPRMIADAHKAGLYTVVSTNAQALTSEWAEALVASGLNRIIISMDGLTDESYNAYRVGGSLERTKAAIRYLREAKMRTVRQRSGLIIELQVLRLRTNEHEWAAFRRSYKALGADRLVFKSAQLYDYQHGHPLMPSDPRYSRYVQGEDGLFRRKRLHRGCLRVWSGVVVTTDGEVLPCCYDKARAHTYGNIMCSPLSELFRNERAVAFRHAALQGSPSICQECWK